MKVLVCIPCLLTGGTEIQTLSLVQALVAAGHQPSVACYFEYNAEMVARYQAAGATVYTLSPDGTRTVGIRAIVKHLYHGLRKVIKSERPDVAHVQYMTPGALTIIMLRLLGVKKILATTHTNADVYGKRGLQIIRWLTNHMLIALQCITTRAEKGYFGEASLFDGTLKKHFTIYNTLPSHIIIAEKPRLNNGDRITVGVVSRLAAIKGMDLVVPAFAAARRKDSRLRLLVVGDGDQRALMERQAAESGYAEDIEFVGVKPQSELMAWYDKIDILLMPSRSEGFGLTAIEGMARGCVPVVSNTGGLPEVVTPECGLLHERENVADMAEKILEATGLLASMSAAAIRRAERFSATTYNKDIKHLYELI